MSDFRFPAMPREPRKGRSGGKAPGVLNVLGGRDSSFLVMAPARSGLGVIGGSGQLHGLVISGVHPLHLRNRFRFGEGDTVWLTDHPSRKEETMSPAELGHRLLARALKHLRSGKRNLLVLDDLEYLACLNGFDAVVRVVKHLADAAADRNSLFVATADPEAFSQNERELLRGCFDRVRVLGPGRRAKEEAPTILLPSTAYLLQEGGPHVYRYINTASAGRSALVVTTVPPFKLKERYGLQRADFIWLTEMEREKEAARPEKLCYEVQRAVLRHLDTRPRPVVFLDSLQLAGSYVSFPETARFVKTVIDAAAERGGTVIASLNTGVLGRSPGAILRKRFDFEVALNTK